MRFFIFMCCLLGLSMLSAQTIVKVQNAQGETLPGASVSYQDTGATTNLNGVAKLPNLKAGTPVTVSFVGYKTLSKPYKKGGMTFVLEEKEMLLEGVVVTSQLPRATEKTPVSYKNISKVELDKSNMGQEIPMLLEGSPSVVTTSDDGVGVGYANFRVRGTASTRINVTFNGVPVNDSESHGVFWVNVPDIASSTKNIQIQRGVGTSTNGAAAFGATVNLETEDVRTEPYAQIGFSGGSFNTFRQNYQAGTGLLAEHFTVDAKYSDVYSSGYMDRAFSDLKSYYAALAYHGENFLLKFLAFGGDQQTYQAWSGVPSDVLAKNRTYNPEGEYTDDNGNTQYYDNHTDNYKQNHYHLFYSQKLNPFWSLNATLHYTKGKGYYESYKEGRKYKKYNLPQPEVGTNASVNPEYLDGTTLKKTNLIQKKWLDNDFYGLVASANYKKEEWEVQLGAAANRYEGDHYGDVIWAKYGFFPKNYRWYFNDGTKDELSAYAKANYQVADDFNLFGDLQYRKIDYDMRGTHDDLRDISQSHSYNFFNPKLGVTYIPNSNFRSYFSWARAHREPSRTNFKEVTTEDKAPKSEQLDDFELGIAYKTATWSLSGNLYYMLYKDQLVHTGAINNVGSPMMTNVADSYRMGIELEAGVKFCEYARWSGNATFSKNEAKDFTEYVDNWTTWGQEPNKIGTTTLAFSPKVVANSVFTFTPVQDFDIALQSNYVSKQYLDNTANGNRSIDSYFVNNLQFNYYFQPHKWFKKVVLNLQLRNIFDVKYETNGWVYSYIEDGERKKLDGIFPQAGFHVMAGITVRF